MSLKTRVQKLEQQISSTEPQECFIHFDETGEHPWFMGIPPCGNRNPSLSKCINCQLVPTEGKIIMKDEPCEIKHSSEWKLGTCNLIVHTDDQGNILYHNGCEKGLHLSSDLRECDDCKIGTRQCQVVTYLTPISEELRSVLQEKYGENFLGNTN